MLLLPDVPCLFAGFYEIVTYPHAICKHCRCKMELIKPAVDWRKAGVKVNTMGAAVAAK
jgi:hypothetical protein